jgi:hypothetical protein
VEALKISYDKL